MKNDIKKKFIDILFETDDDDTPEQVEKQVEEFKTENSFMSAKDLLYRKSDSPVFVDLDDKEKAANSIIDEERAREEEAKKYGDYEMSAQISPIFGVVAQKKREVVHKPMNEKLLSRPESSHLEIIPSPIYGYGTREDYEGVKSTDDNLPYESDDELHRLLDNDNYVDRTFDDFGEDDDELNLFNTYDQEEE